MNYNDDNIEHVLEYVSSDCSRHDWVIRLCGIKDWCGESGYQIALDWSKQSSKFNQKNFDATWESIKSGPITKATLFEIAYRNGLPRPVKSDFTTKEKSALSCSQDKPPAFDEPPIEVYDDTQHVVESTENDFSGLSQPIASSAYLPVILENMPTQLRPIKNWVLWRPEPRKDDSNKMSKVPYTVNGYHANTIKPATWSTFDGASDVFKKTDKYSGLGFVLKTQIDGHDLVGIDVDYPFDSEIAVEFRSRFADTYIEKSPSDKLRIFCTGVIPRSGKGVSDHQIEVYNHTSPRYLTVTGHRLNQCNITLQQDALNWLFETYFTPKHNLPILQQRTQPGINQADTTNSVRTIATQLQPIVQSPSIEDTFGKWSDDELIDQIRKSKNGQKFDILFSGGSISGNESNDDYRLCCQIAFYAKSVVGSGPDQIFRIVARSQRANVKNHKWNRVGQKTCQNAFDKCEKPYDPGFNFKFFETDQKKFNADLKQLAKIGCDVDSVIAELTAKHPTIEGMDLRVKRAIDACKHAIDKVFEEFSYKQLTGSDFSEGDVKAKLLDFATDIDSAMVKFNDFSTAYRNELIQAAGVLDLTGLNIHRSNERYINLPIPELGSTFIIKSPMGSGKTLFLKNAIDQFTTQNLSSAYVCHRVSLSLNAASVLKIDHYQTELSTTQAVSIVVNSIPNFEGFAGDPDVVIVDENDQVLKHITGTACQNGNEVLDSLKKWISRAKIVIVMSADIDQLTINLIKNLRPGQIDFFENSHKPRAGQEVTIYPKVEMIYEGLNSHFLNQYSNGCVIIASNSIAESQKLEKYLKDKFPSKRGFCVNSDNSQSESTKEVMKCINEKINDWDYFIFSPSISSGVSIDNPNISAIFGIFHAGSGNTCYDAWQQIGRVRRLDIPTYLWVDNRRNFDLPITEDAILEVVTKKMKAESVEIQKADRPDWTGFSVVKSVESYKFTDYDRLYMTCLKNTNTLNQDFKAAFIVQGLVKGVHFLFENVVTEERKESIDLAKEDRKSVSESLKVDNSIAILNARDLTTTEIHDLLSDNNALSRDDRLAIEKYSIAKEFGVATDNTTAFKNAIELDNDGQGRKIVKRIKSLKLPIENVGNDDIYLLQNLMNEGRLSEIADRKLKLLDRAMITRVFDATGVTYGDDGLIASGKFYDQTDPAIKDFCDWCFESGIAPQKITAKNRVQFVGRKLASLNIKTQRKKVSGKLVTTIILDEYEFNQFLAFKKETTNETDHLDPSLYTVVGEGDPTVEINTTRLEVTFEDSGSPLSPKVYRYSKGDDECNITKTLKTSPTANNEQYSESYISENVKLDAKSYSENYEYCGVPRTIFHDDLDFWHEKTKLLSIKRRNELAFEYDKVNTSDCRKSANLMILDAIAA